MVQRSTRMKRSATRDNSIINNKNNIIIIIINKPDLIVRDNEKGTCMLIDIVI